MSTFKEINFRSFYTFADLVKKNVRKLKKGCTDRSWKAIQLFISPAKAHTVAIQNSLINYILKRIVQSQSNLISHIASKV